MKTNGKAVERMNPSKEATGEIVEASNRQVRRAVSIDIPSGSEIQALTAKNVSEVLHQSLGTIEKIMQNVRDMSDGVEIEFNTQEVLNLTEKPNERSVTYTRNIDFRKDR